MRRHRSQHSVQRASSDHADAAFVVVGARYAHQRVKARLLHGRGGRMLA